MNKYIHILGAGTYGEVLMELAMINGFKVRAFYDDDDLKIGKKINDITVEGKINLSQIDCKNKSFIVAIGDNKLRSDLSEQIIRLGGELPNLIHPKAEISSSVKLGKGCIVHALTYLWTKVELGSFSIISPKVIVAHHTVLKNGCFVSSGANVGANMLLKERTFVGIGATIMTGVKVLGKNCIIGAGSTVIHDVADDTTVAGVPAREITRK